MTYKAIFYPAKIGTDTTHFTLIGRPTTFFKLTWDGKHAGIPCVAGEYHNHKGKRFHTLARIEDVNFHSLPEDE